MERTKTLLAVLFVVCASALLFWSIRRSKIADEAATGLTAASEAKDAIDFTLPDAATGKPFHLIEQAKVRPLVLDFWATWCGPCREELPHLEALSRKYRGRIAFYGINSSDSPAMTTAFVTQNGLTFPMLSDSKHNVAFLYGADAIPLLLVVDTEGKVRSGMNGYDLHVEADLSKTLDALLAEQTKAP